MTCPRCKDHPELEYTDHISMLKCPSCHRWWRHIATPEGCGVVGTIKDVGPESFTACRAQGELFAST